MRDRRGQILASLVGNFVSELDGKCLCDVCAEVIDVSGAGIMLMSGGERCGSLCSSNKVSALIEELQYSLGEGPCMDAFELGLPVVEIDLAEPDLVRWPAFAAPALDAGVRAVFCFPLGVGAVRLGALSLYSDRPGPLSRSQQADAAMMADVAVAAILILQAHAPTGRLAVELERGADFHSVVNQAAGMISVQLGVRVGQALVRMRAYAFSTDRRLAEVAEDVVARRLRLDADGAD